MKIPAYPSILPLLLAIFLLPSCGEDVNPNYAEEVADPEFYHASVKRLTDVIVHDIFSPPVAARIYSYSSIAGYEALAAGDSSLVSLAGQLSDLTPAPAPAPGIEISYPIAALAAQSKVGHSLIFSMDKIEAFREELLQKIDSIGVPDQVVVNSVDYGEQVADHIIAWYDGDMYKQTRTFPKYSLTDDETKWQPTPPDYMDGIEPSWNRIRPYTLDSASQFKPLPPTEVSTDPESQWMKEVMEVYSVFDGVSEAEAEERRAIAKFWDCNPYATTTRGHLMFATKKISPGGHWINIAAIAARKAGADFTKSVETYALMSVAMNDAFISCWDEKYRSRLLRPETFINRHIDETWLPLLQTPPFPEHTSGHSVVSRACAIVLTHLYGDNFAFDDDSELEYDLPTRSFPSFLAASEEAAESRLFGGIHYRPAIDYGVTQGEQVGKHVLLRARTRVEDGSRSAEAKKK